ncbi:MAG: acylneuraminate cytidylyltransferase family protein [Muribaculaceae bacterium]|nr:acylneuraminate cytidylyltransferase family protein [Muribaculaceae bacterium]
MKPLYIIPARGGSKGIPHKNIKSLGGRPLIAYTIDCATEAAKHIGGTIVLSTDDEDIAATARECGLDVEYLRPAELGLDTTGSREVMLDVMDWADSKGIEYNCVVLLQPTSPLRTYDDIEMSLVLFSDDVDMVVSVCPSDDNPYYNLFECTADGTLKVCKGDGLYTRRQDVPQVYKYNGAVYVIRPESLREMPMGAFPKRIPYYMPAVRSIDLDTPDDWQRAEQIIRDMKS